MRSVCVSGVDGQTLLPRPPSLRSADLRERSDINRAAARSERTRERGDVARGRDFDWRTGAGFGARASAAAAVSVVTDPEPAVEGATTVVPRFRRWLAPLFLLAALALIPWTVYLFVSLPGRHLQTGYYDLAWGGFDLALASVLAATGYGLLRRRLWVQSTATAAATMLVCDAWFDILSANDSGERLLAVSLALAVELPTAVLCLLIARNVEEVAERAQRYAVSARRLRPRRRGDRRDTEAPA